MPRHLISDVHEWSNEIPTVPVYYSAKPQPRERAWVLRRGKKTPLRFILVPPFGGGKKGEHKREEVFFLLVTPPFLLFFFFIFLKKKIFFFLFLFF